MNLSNAFSMSNLGARPALQLAEAGSKAGVRAALLRLQAPQKPFHARSADLSRGKDVAWARQRRGVVSERQLCLQQRDLSTTGADSVASAAGVPGSALLRRRQLSGSSAS